MAAVSTAEREIKEDVTWQEGDRGRLKPRAGKQERRHQASGQHCAEPSLYTDGSDAPDQGAPMNRESDMRSKILKPDCLHRPLLRDEVLKGFEVAGERLAEGP